MWAENKFGRRSEFVKLTKTTLKDFPLAPEKPIIEFIPQKYNQVRISFTTPKCYQSKPTAAEVKIDSQTTFIKRELLNSKKIYFERNLDEYELIGDTMQCRIRVHNSKGAGKWSEPAYIDATSLTPLKPEIVSISSVKSEIKIKWKPPRKLQRIIDHYEIERLHMMS